MENNTIQNSIQTNLKTVTDFEQLKQKSQPLINILKETSLSFKDSHTFEQRFLEYQIIRCNYPDFICISLQLTNTTNIQDTNKKINFRLYVSADILVGFFRHFIKDTLQQRLPSLQKSNKISLYCGDDEIIKHDIELQEVYQHKAEQDGWLYIDISIEN